jgi:hypothetical protein
VVQAPAERSAHDTATRPDDAPLADVVKRLRPLASLRASCDGGCLLQVVDACDEAVGIAVSRHVGTDTDARLPFPVTVLWDHVESDFVSVSLLWTLALLARVLVTPALVSCSCPSRWESTACLRS